MDYIVRDYVEEYIRSLIKQEPELLPLLEYAKEHHTPIIHPEVAQLMKLLIGIKKPKRLLELGTAIGYSALVFSRAMGEGSKVLTIEKQDKLIDIAQNSIEKLGLEDSIKIEKGLIEEVLPKLDEKFDIIFIDAAKGHYLDFLPHCLRLLDKGGIIVSDNVLFKGMIASDSLVIRRKKTIVKRMRDYLEYISTHKELETSVIPIGDGLAISRRVIIDEA